MIRLTRVAVLLLALCTAACSDQGEDTSVMDLARGQAAYARHDIADAEMYFQRFLRKNPGAPERWDVWNRLLNIALNIRQERTTAAAYLEIMLEEFSHEDERRRGMEMELAAISRALRNDNRAVELWEKLAEDEGTPPEEKAEVYRHLSHVYLSRLEFTVAENVLQACLELDVKASTKADCLYDMAEGQVLTENLPLAETNLQTLLKMGGATENRTVLALFLLGDVLEQQGRYGEALERFGEIRTTFPNRQVIENRITYLEKKQRKEVVSPQPDKP